MSGNDGKQQLRVSQLFGNSEQLLLTGNRFLTETDIERLGLLIQETLVMAFREIFRNPMRSLLTLLGIVIGVGSVIAMVGLGRSVTASISSDISNMGSNLLILMPGTKRQGPQRMIATPFKMADVDAIRKQVTDVGKIAPVGQSNKIVVFGNKNWSSTILGTTQEYMSIRNFAMAYGVGLADANGAVCVIGATVRKELFGGMNPVGETLRVGGVACMVVGAAASKGTSTVGPDMDDFVLMPIGVFQRRVAGRDDVSMVFISATSEGKVRKVQQQIEQLMRERRRIPAGGAADFSVEDSREIAKTLESVTGTLTAFLSAIAGVSLLVGGIGIMNIMLVSVTERTREIGIRLSIGASSGEVLMQFLVEAATLSTLGGIIGILIGLGVSFAATKMLVLPFTMSVDVIVLAVGFSCFVGVVFGYLPARKAASLNPIDALRHE